MKVISKLIIVLTLLLGILIFYLSIFGIETDRFNSQILNKIKEIDEKTKIELKKIKLVFDPISLKINIKTIGSKLKKKNRIIEIENIKAQISIKSLISNKFAIENLEISTKSLEIKNLIYFLRSFKNSPELFILENTIKKGYLVADIKLEFDSNGKIRDNYEIEGFIKDARLSVLKKYNLKNLDLIFEYKKNNLLISDITFSLNNLNFLSEKIILKKKKDNFLVEGNINHKKLNFDKENLDLFLQPLFPKLKIQKIKFNSNNSFVFEITKKFEIKNYNILSEMFVDELLISNNFNLKNFFPNIKKDVLFSDNKISIEYNKNYYSINGSGDILLQDKKDSLNFRVNKNNKIVDFKGSLIVKDNPFIINFLNYKKSEKNEINIQLEGQQKKNETFVKKLFLSEAKNKINFKNLVINQKFEIINLDSIKLDYIDKDKQKNFLDFYKKKKFI